MTFTKDECEYQFPIDTELDKKFPKWAPVLLSMLVDIAYKTQGKVNDVHKVTEATKQYRDEQDIIFQFYREMVEVNPDPEKYPNIRDDKIFIANVRNYTNGNAAGRTIDPKDVKAFFEKRHGKPVNKEYKGIMWRLSEDEREANQEMSA